MFENEMDQVFSATSTDQSWIKDNTIFMTVHGSTCYGLNTPESDIDLKGILIPPKSYFLGFNKNIEQFITKAPRPDCTIFNIQKFFSLAIAGNPNCLEILFTEPEHHVKVTSLGKILLDKRQLFVSKLLKERYLGYARSQMHRIINHKKWLNTKMDHCPTREEMGLPEKPSIEKDQFDAIKSLINKKVTSWIPDFEPFSESQKIYLQNKVADILAEMKLAADDQWQSAARLIGLDNNLIDAVKKEKEYENKLKDWDDFLQWKKNRNPKRAELEEKFSFDTKHASHLIRLLTTCKEILETGEIHVKRTYDRELLMDIKQGKWKYDDLIKLTDKIEKEALEAYKKSTLPNQPNIKLLDELCVELIERSFAGEK